MRNTEAGLQSVERAIVVLQRLAEFGPLRSSELARSVGVHTSTISRLLATLERLGMVHRVDDGASFVVGHGVALLAARAAQPRGLTDVARPVMAALVASLNESVSLNLLTDDGCVLTVDQILGSAGITGFNWLGQRSPLIATAAGKVLCAAMPTSELLRYLTGEPQRFTEHTLTRDAFVAELPAVRAQGYAVCRDELELGLSAISAPVQDYSGMTAALSASLPTARLDDLQQQRIVNEVVDAAKAISAQLGGHT